MNRNWKHPGKVFVQIRPRHFKLALLAVTIAAVGLWRGAIVYSRSGLEEIARNHGSPEIIFGVPQANSDGIRIVLSQMDREGVGVYLFDPGPGKKQLVHRKVSPDDWFQTVDVWPWSPDDRHFLYTHTNLFVCDGATGEEQASLPVEGVNGIAALVWLSPESFVYVSKAGNLHRFDRSGETGWKKSPNLRLKAGANNLTALSTNVICWQRGDNIWGLNLDSRIASVLFHSGTNRLSGFSYNSRSRQFVISSTGTRAELFRMEYTDGVLEHLQPLASDDSAHALQALDGKASCAFIADRVNGDPYLKVLPAAGAPAATLFENGKVDGVSSSGDGRKLFVVGAMGKEPASSVWVYDVDSGNVLPVVRALEHLSAQARRLTAREETVTLGGRKLTYHIYEPESIDPKAHQKYPLVLGDTLYNVKDPAYQNRVHGPYWAPMLANAGAYVVIVERPGAWFNEMERWEESVQWVHNKMLRNPTIDTNKVYLFATSAETVHLSRLVENKPGLWRGLILLNPGVLPDLDKLATCSSPPKILFSQGALEGDRVWDYQMKALGKGIRVEGYAHKGSAHILLGTDVLGERAQAMMQFVFGD